MQLITRECFRRPRNSYPTYSTSWSICRITSSRARTTNNMSILILRNKWSCGELNESQNNISKILKKLLFKFLLFKWTRTEPSTGPHCLSAYLNDKVTWDLTSWYLFLLFSRLVHRSTASLLRPSWGTNVSRMTDRILQLEIKAQDGHLFKKEWSIVESFDHENLLTYEGPKQFPEPENGVHR